ncbi:MAG: hypothetical protein HY209_06740 [Candidatus Omnitrophica bacterium]|nr:hypothetical protein [Candidatus Omnitrophota bacterium]
MILLLIAVATFAFGLFLMTKPLEAFEWQRRFYALINWRIEPISVEKEIRHTKLMGAFLILLTIVLCTYQWFILKP